MHLPGSSTPWIVAFAALVLGCQPSIGDSCKLHTDCSATGNRLCEPNLPGGYCTIFNCEPGSCPSEAVCVAYSVAPSSKPECADVQSPRLERTFCMKACSSSSDCRSGYACVDLSDPSTNYWGAVVAESSKSREKICTVPLTDPAKLASGIELSNSDGGNEGEVCLPPADASFPPVPDAALLVEAGLDASRRRAGDAARDAAGRPDAAAAPDGGRRDAGGTP